MSWLPCAEPGASERRCPDGVEMVIVPRTSDVGGFEVRRALPFRDRRMVGPFIFWDEMGPGEFLHGQGMDVRPHPHIGLSTITYLVRGELEHRDSLGTLQTIQPGDVNLMSAGTGIVHSERTASVHRQAPHWLSGIQSWVAQPRTHEDQPPAFVHTSQNDLPEFSEEGVHLRLILGRGWGLQSPVPLQWDTLYADVSLCAGSRLFVAPDTEERALYAVTGDVEVEGIAYPPRQLLVLRPGREVSVQAASEARLLVLGGAVMDGPRYIWWNFVSSSKEKLEHAARQWQSRQFPAVPGDEDEYIPLPNLPRLSSIRD